MVNNKKKRIFDIIQIGYAGDVASRTFDIAITAAIIINLFIAIFDTFEQSITYQPEVFKNAFSGIWWSVSTLLTVGYGDIYPVTVLGKMFSIIITFLGVGMVAIPTGILSAGFVEQYSLIKKSTDYLMEKELKFIKLIITKDHNWNEKKVCELNIPRGLILAAVLRNGETLIKSGDIVFVFSKRYMADAQTISV
ncbi:ion transporter [Lachnospira eligens]|jgi:voltage-gated potassium channel|uniref:Potassium channel domain-containing protein n=1 Tax=Lachnospira eligens (strain ATCC 27750 / DSM 3376 / VPI C15-48 / C15-B4) TaxID=515620 RepID=C4Z388_LACE2|nr:potassium channel family protein [Lachnospira eligens]ACR72678.1 Hypothetical protein EUBELI_01687 [[Eubacterium] eligens ATCC 27750]UEA98280.1 ion transporter [Lachnospira eligens]